MGGVEAGEQDAVRFEAAFEFGGDLQGDSPWEVVQAEAGEDDVNAVRGKWKRLAVVQLDFVSVGSGQLGERQVHRREIRGDDVAPRVQEFGCVPAAAASQFENTLTRAGRSLPDQVQPFIQPGIVFHVEEYITKQARHTDVPVQRKT